MSVYNIYGIPNCNSVKKAIDFFEKNNLSYHFINFKKSPISPELLQSWIAQVDINLLVNKKGTTWKKVDESIREKELTVDIAQKLILDNNSLVKRPVISLNDKIITIGYDDHQYSELFLSHQ